MRLALALAVLIPAESLAQASSAPLPAESERRLSAEEIEAILAEAARKREAAEARAGTAIQPGMTGELAVSVGTGGYREVVGTGLYPLGDEGAALISLDYIDVGKRRPPR